MLMEFKFKGLSPIGTCPRCKNLYNTKIIEGDVFLQDGKIVERVYEIDCKCDKPSELRLRFSADIRSK